MNESSLTGMLKNIFTYLILIFFLKISFADDNIYQFPASISEIQQSDLKKYINSDSLFSYQLNDKKLNGIFLPNMAASKRGTIIIIPDINKPILDSYSSPSISGPLTDEGYDIYIMQSFEIDNAQASKGDNAENKSSKNERFTNLVLDNLKKDIIKAFNNVYDSLKLTSNDKLIVMTQGITAGVFSEYLATLPKIQLHAFVIMDPFIPNTQREKHLAANLSIIGPPILDFTYKDVNVFLHICLKCV